MSFHYFKMILGGFLLTSVVGCSTLSAYMENTLATVPGGRAAVSFIKSYTEDNGDEVKVGRTLAGRLLGAAPLIDHDDANKYINQVGMWVAQQSERPDLSWSFGIIESNTVGAYAMPGGYILITRGLFDILEFEDELAGVLGHEIAHVTRQDHYKVIRKQKLLQVGLDIANEKVKERINQPLAENLADKLLGAGGSFLLTGLDRGAEYACDELGTSLINAAGYNPLGLYSALQKIDEASVNPSMTKLLYSTHPTAEKRLENIDNEFEVLMANSDNNLRLLRVFR